MFKVFFGDIKLKCLIIVMNKKLLIFQITDMTFRILDIELTGWLIPLYDEATFINSDKKYINLIPNKK